MSEFPTPGPDFEAPVMALDSLPADPAPAMGGRRYSARRYGKTYRIAERASQACGLSTETCLDLLTRGWTLVQTSGEPARWYDPSYRLTKRP